MDKFKPMPLNWARPPSSKRVILSLCDHTGMWARPYVEDVNELVFDSSGNLEEKVSRYHVYLIDIKDPVKPDYLPDDLWIDESQYSNVTRVQLDVREMERWIEAHLESRPWGVLAAPPCTDFSGSGARWWAEKDADGRTDLSISIARSCVRVGKLATKFWALENPVGRLNRWLGKPKMYFHPYHYGDPHSKKTALWGDFNTDLTRRCVEPVMYTTKGGKKGSYSWAKYGGKSEKTKTMRSITPSGFARAFKQVNP